MDRKTIFSKTAKGLMEAAGKTSALSRDMRTVLKEIDGKSTVGEVQAKFAKIPEAKLQEALQILAKSDFIRELAPIAKTPAPPPKSTAPSDDDLDFTVAIPTMATIAKQAEEAAKQKAQAAAAAEAAARAKAEADEKAKVAAAEAAARAKAEALEKAKAAAAAEAAARGKAEAEARTRAAAVEAAARAKAEADEKAKAAAAEAAARAKAEVEARAKQEAEEGARREAAEKARREADELRAKLEEERKAREEAERKANEESERQRKEAEEKAQREADELRAKIEEERRAREEAERKAKEVAERERREAEEKARREADELRAKIEDERKAREEAERKAKEESERQRREAEEKARREADELRARLEEERKAREEAERKVTEEAERKVKEDAEREAKEHAEREAKEHAEREAKEHAERVTREAEESARKEAEDQAGREAERKEAEDRLRREAEEKARKDAEQKDAEQKATEDRARRESEEQARLVAQAKSGVSLDDLVKIETDFDAVMGVGAAAKDEAAKVSAAADDKLRQEAEARREAEERARSEAQASAREAAEAEAKHVDDERGGNVEKEREQEYSAHHALGDLAGREREYAEAQALIDAQNAETERHFADMEKELEAEEVAAKAQQAAPELPPETGKQSKGEAQERVRPAAAVYSVEEEPATEEVARPYRTPVNWGKPVALGLFLFLVVGLVSIHFVPFDGFIPQLEKLAGAHLQQPVKIKTLHLSLVPMPHWRLDGVSAGTQGQLTVERINAFAELGSMFSERKAFRSIELESPQLSEEGLFALLFGKPQGQDLKVANISVKNGKLDSKTIILPALDAKISMDENSAWKRIALETPDHKTSLLLEPKGEGAQLEVETNVFSTPFGPAFLLENFSAKGMIGRDQLSLSEFKGAIYGGYLSGSANLKWGANWSLGGEVSARAMDSGRIVPALFEEGALEGKAAYAMRAKSYEDLFAAPRLEGTFTVLKGSLIGVDLARLLQGGGIGGKTAFPELSGSFVRDGGRTQLSQLRLTAGPVSASGSADADARKNVSGRFSVELKSPVAQARANLALSGTLREPRFSR